MKILIFSADFGNGHKKVASYLANKYKEEGHTVEILNPHYMESKLIAKTSENIYSFISKNTKYKLIKNSYGIAFEIFSQRNGTIFSTFGEKKIRQSIQQYQPDLVIFTFPYQPKNIKTKSTTVITDYGFSKNWYNESHSYIVGSEQIKEDLLKIDDTLQIYNAGIPIGEEIQKEIEHIPYKENINNQSFLINLGALGICNFKQIKRLLQVLKEKNMKVIIICGRNTKLYNKLDKYIKEKELQDIELNGYVEDIKKIYQRTNIMFTKAGGVTITEAINYEIPLLIDIQSSMLGQEKLNIDFIKKENIGMTLKSENIDIIRQTINDLINDYNQKCKNMQKLKEKYNEVKEEIKTEGIL